VATPILLCNVPLDGASHPSITLGTLRAVLKRAGLPSSVRYLNLEFYEHARTATDGLPEPERLTVEGQRNLVDDHNFRSLGDWIFRLPELFDGDCAAADEAYLAWLGEELGDRAGSTIPLARRLRALVGGFLRDAADRIAAERPRVVGFSLMFSQTVAALAMARLLKQRDPTIRTVFGGACCDDVMGAQLIRSFSAVDVVVRGESELVVPTLFRELVEGAPITPQSGLLWRERGGVREVAVTPARFSMDEVPQPDFDEYFQTLDRMRYGDELRPHVTLVFEASRGCWWGERHHCTFCGLNAEAMKFRAKSIDRVYDELVEQARKHQVLTFNATDNILDLDHIDQLMPRLRDSGIDFDIFFELKTNLRKREILALREGGVRRFYGGVESLSTAILKLLKKGSTLLGNLQFLKWSHELKIGFGWLFLVGVPQEPIEAYDEMARLVPSLTHLVPPAVLLPVQAHRFSPYHTNPDAHGIRLTRPVQPLEHIYPSLSEAERWNLAYNAVYEHVDHPPLESYIGPLRMAVEEWRRAFHAGASLQLRRGPDHLRIVDERVPGRARLFVLTGADAAIYLACDAAATTRRLGEVAARAGHPLSADELEARLRKLADDRLLVEERGRWLALAIPTWDTLREADRSADDDEPTEDPADHDLVRIGRALQR
jgi:ribosomal peptide maturation radical SAM protein 1